jgi:hypothetical protein
MKTFAQFVKEAVQTLASTQAKTMGLVGDGHGDWYDKQGNLVAKTVSGKLKVFGKGGSPEQQQVQQKDTPQKTQTQKTTPRLQQKEPSQETKQPKGAVVVLGRFNPPSKNDDTFLKFGFNQAKTNGFDYFIYPSRIQDDTTNPLSPKEKISYMKSIFKTYADYIVDSEEIANIFDVLTSLGNDGYTDIKVVVGQDRLGEFQNIAHKGQGQQYNFNNLEVLSAGMKDPDSDSETQGSSAKMRAAAAVGDYQSFFSSLPNSMKRQDKEKLFSAVTKSMKVTENTELWEVAPELDVEGLRYHYKNSGLFDVGSLVENQNTGLIGRILRRGTNHLICVTKEGVMFKSWLKDVKEVHEIGTCEYRAYLQSITPNQPVEPYTEIEIKPTIPKKKINMSSKRSLDKK